MRKRYSFTLIEMIISVIILSVMMLFLYKTQTTFRLSSDNIKKETDSIVRMQKIKKTLYMDFALAINKSLKIQNRQKNEDVVFLQTSNSIHKRYNPYIVYKVKNKKLYRTESLKPIMTYEFPADSEFDADCLGEVESFRVYKSSDTNHHTCIIYVKFKKEEVFFKVKILN